MRLALVAHGHHPLVEPFAGGLETFTTHLVRGLRARGHHVLLYAAEGTDPSLADELVEFERSPLGGGRASVPSRTPSAPDPIDHPETRAYLGVAADLVRRGASIDVVANHSLQPTVLAVSAAFSAPTVTTLHTPPLAPVAAAAPLADHRHRFVAVSGFIARAWDLPTRPAVIANGVDTAVFRPGPGGPRAVWSGRMTPEKGPQVAIAAARRAGIGLDLVGPVSEPAWFAGQVAPLLGEDVRHLGPLGHEALAEVVGRSAVALVTPQWDEPFGLVAAEAIACGTPVAALARGALPEVVGHSGVLADPDDGVAGLARALTEAAGLDRAEVAADGARRFPIDRMVDAYERCYASVQRPSA